MHFLLAGPLCIEHHVHVTPCYIFATVPVFCYMYMYAFANLLLYMFSRISYPLQSRVQEVLKDMGRNSVEFFTELMEAFHHVRLTVMC